MILQEQAQKLIDDLDKRSINPFVSMAKCLLGLAVFVCLDIIAIGFLLLVFGRDRCLVGDMVSAAQVLTVIALSIMGWHGYKGSQLLYVMRHLTATDPTQ